MFFDILLIVTGALAGWIVRTWVENAARVALREWYLSHLEEINEQLRNSLARYDEIRKRQNRVLMISAQAREELNRAAEPCDGCGKHWNAYQLVAGRSLCIDCARRERIASRGAYSA